MTANVESSQPEDRMGGSIAASASIEVRGREGEVPAVEFRHVHFSFDDQKVLDDISFTVQICELVIKLRDLENVSSILVTHEMDVVKYITSAYAVVSDDGKISVKEEGDKLCLTNTSILMLRKGRVIFNGVEEELVKSENPYIQEFIRGTEVEVKATEE